MAFTVNTRTLLQPALEKRHLSRLANLPFWAHGPENAFKTTHQTDFKADTSCYKKATFLPPVLAQAGHRDLHVKEYQAETAALFPAHRPVLKSSTPAWSKLTNVKMPTDQRRQNIQSNHSANFQHLPAISTRPRAVQPVEMRVKPSRQVKLPDIHHRASDIPHKNTPVLKAACKDLERIRINPRQINVSSIPQGDTDERRNQKKTTTTNLFFFPEEKHKQLPFHVDGSNLMTKSNVRIGEPSLSSSFYSTTTRENYAQKQLAPAQLHRFPPSRHILGDQEPVPAVSTTQRDYTPLNCRRHDLSAERQRQIKYSHIRPPCNEYYLKTSYKEDFTQKPFSRTYLENPPLQHISHMPF